MIINTFDDFQLRFNAFKKGFKFGFNNVDKLYFLFNSRTFFIGRFHFGTYIATVMSFYNLYLLK